jgi:hypothetical protein
MATQDPRPKRRKPAKERKRNNVTFRARDQLKADLERAAEASGRSLSEEIEYRLGQAFQWERILGDLDELKVRTGMFERDNLEHADAPLHWSRRHKLDYLSAPANLSGLPPTLRELVRAEVQAALRTLLEEYGLAAHPKKKSV